MDYQQALSRLCEAGGFQSTRVARRLANELEDSLLGVDHAPEEYVEFLIRVLSSEQLAVRAGLEHLVLAVYVDRDKFSSDQLDRILECAVSHYGFVATDAMAYALGDFVARVASPAKALKYLHEMSLAAKSQAALSGVFLGVSILRRLVQPGDVDQSDALRTLTQLAEQQHLVLGRG